MDGTFVASGYADHLTDADLRLLAAAAEHGGQSSGSAVSWLRSHPDKLPGMLADPGVFSAVFGPADSRPRDAARSGPAAQAALASPFLIFAVAVNATAADLEAAGHVPERSGPRQRVPLFDAPELRDFLSSQARRLFLAELLASFTRVTSGQYHSAPGTPAPGAPQGPVSQGPVPHGTPPGAAPHARPGAVPPARGRRGARRFSELDLPRMARQLDDVPEAERPGMYRRLGDVALFLTGVFPDYAASRALGPVSAARLLAAAGVPARHREELEQAGAIDLFEYLGARWYRAAWTLASARTARLAVVAEVADRFRQARRVLNHIADRRLFPEGDSFFPRPGSF